MLARSSARQLHSHPRALRGVSALTLKVASLVVLWIALINPLACVVHCMVTNAGGDSTHMHHQPMPPAAAARTRLTFIDCTLHSHLSTLMTFSSAATGMLHHRMFIQAVYDSVVLSMPPLIHLAVAQRPFVATLSVGRSHSPTLLDPPPEV